MEEESYVEEEKQKREAVPVSQSFTYAKKDKKMDQGVASRFTKSPSKARYEPPASPKGAAAPALEFDFDLLGDLAAASAPLSSPSLSWGSMDKKEKEKEKDAPARARRSSVERKPIEATLERRSFAGAKMSLAKPASAKKAFDSADVRVPSAIFQDNRVCVCCACACVCACVCVRVCVRVVACNETCAVVRVSAAD
jgi:hypothetical protein